MRRFGHLNVVTILAFIMTGCGDTYRPVVIPNPPPTPDPKAAHNVFVISDNGDAKGTGMQVNVSGDTNMGVVSLGNAPVHAALNAAGSRLISANFLNDTVSLMTPASSVSSLSKIDVGLPVGSRPSFVATEEASVFYVANSGSLEDPAAVPPRPEVKPSLAFVSATSNAVLEIKDLPGSSVGTTLTLAETPDARKVYVASSNANSVIPVNPIDRTFNDAIPIPSPTWVSARSDSGRVYVLSTTGLVTEIDPLTDAASPTPIIAGGGVDFMFYDSKLNRLYITNPITETVTVGSVGSNPAQALTNLTTFPVAPRVDSTCTGSVTPLTTVALPDGTRVYVIGRFVGSCVTPSETVTCVASTVGQPSGSSLCLQATVLSANDFTIRGSIAIPPIAITSVSVCETTRFPISAEVSADSSKVYVGSCDAGGVFVIRTDTDTFANKISAPPSARRPPVDGGAPPPQNPVFVLPGQ